MKFRYMIAGLFFLILPDFGIYDFLPDFIGYMLILHAISDWADLALPMEESRKYFLRLFYLDLFKFFTMLLMMIIQASGAVKDDGFFGLFTFTFGIFEILFFLLAFSRFFDGMSYLATRHGGNAAVAHITDLRTLSVIFILVKSTLAFLSQVGTLITADSSGTLNPFGQGGMNLSSYGHLLTIANLLFTTVIGAVFFGFMIRYLRGIAAEHTFIQTLQQVYDAEILPKAPMFLERRMRMAFLLLGGCVLFQIDLHIDGINILPDVISAAFFLGALFILRKENPAWQAKHSDLPAVRSAKEHLPPAQALYPWWIFIPSGIYFVLTLVQEIFTNHFYHTDYDTILTKGLTYYPQIFQKYLVTIGLSLICGIFFVWGAWLCVCFLRKIVKLHIGMLHDPEDTSAIAKIEQMHRQFYSAIYRFFACAVILAVSSLVYAIVVPWFPLYWLPHAIIGFIFTFTATKLFSNLCDQVEYKYL